MFQTFAPSTRPDQGPPRLEALRLQMAAEGLDGFLIPRADAHQGEYVAPRDERLAWLTGFTGSAGFCAVLKEVAGLFVDGRYTLQAAAQVETGAFSPVLWPKTELADWLPQYLPSGGKVGFDPWLHTPFQLEELRKKCTPQGIEFVEVENLVDRIWEDQPGPPQAPALPHDLSIAGEPHGEKRKRVAETLTRDGQRATLLTQPDSIAWLLNIRGGDIARTPVAHGYAILHDNGEVDLFLDEIKVSPQLLNHLGSEVHVMAPSALIGALGSLQGPVRIDPKSAPIALVSQLAEPVTAQDPCALPRARKNAQELKGMEAAHHRDGLAIVRLLHWLDGALGSGQITEIDVVTQLEAFRREAPELRDISFETIAGSGPHGAIVHYRVTTETNRVITPGELLLIDSGGQYADGTTDITRTLATGPVTQDQRQCFTRVLKGMIAISQAIWPKGLAGRDLDALARTALWHGGLDYDHGTGHGVGAYLGVHEGPQSLSRRSAVALEPGMVLSNEPGYYREGAFGIRIENLVYVVPASPDGGDAHRSFLRFETLTWAPIDRRLIATELLTQSERDWLDSYHEEVHTRLAAHLPPETAAWLARATAPLT